MLSIFPTLINYQEVGPLLIRVALAAALLFSSYKTLRAGNIDPWMRLAVALEFVSGIMILVGVWTQVAAIYVVLDLIVRLVFKAINKSLFTDGVNYYVLLLAMALSLLVSGAGVLAFDIRL